MPTSQEHPDPVIEAQIARTLAPYQGIATPGMLETMREQLAEMLGRELIVVGDELAPGGALLQRRNVGDAAHGASRCFVGVASVVGVIARSWRLSREM